jgi:LacI family transcriptional regulator
MTPGVASADPARDTASAPSRPTINDIARIADVSKKTVSRVLNKSPFVSAETRQKVEAIIERTSYSPDPQARG